MRESQKNQDPSAFPVFDEEKFPFDAGYFHKLLDEPADAGKHHIVHVTIPFCDSICAFCSANRRLYDPVLAASFLEALKYETGLYARTERVRSMSIDALYLHGGTPTALSTVQLADLLDYFREHFAVSRDLEITIESTTHNFSEEKAKKLAELGVDRVYFGVQTFHDRMRKWLNRTESCAAVIDKIDMVRRLGFDAVRIDLMYGLPGETMEMWEEDLATVSELEVDNLSIFKFRPYPEIRATRMMRAGELPPINEAEREKMYENAVEVISRRGYVRQYTSGFALPEKRSRYFDLFYKSQCDGIGLGPTNWFYGCIGNYLHKNIDDISMYMEKLRKRDFPIAVGYQMSTEEKARRAVIKGLSWGIDCRDFEKKFGAAPYERFGDEFRKLERDGIVSNVDGEIRLTDAAVVNGDMKPYLALFLPGSQPFIHTGE